MAEKTCSGEQPRETGYREAYFIRRVQNAEDSNTAVRSVAERTRCTELMVRRVAEFVDSYGMDYVREYYQKFTVKST